MADVWKSYEKHYCKICDCWLSGHKRNILNHERSERHQNNLNHGMLRMKKRERDDENHAREVERELKKITTAANAAVYGTGGNGRNKGSFTKPFNRGNPLLDNVMNPELMNDFKSVNVGTLEGIDHDFTLDEFSHNTRSNNEGAVPEKPVIDENPYAPSFRFNAPAYQQPKSYEMELKAIASLVTKKESTDEKEPVDLDNLVSLKEKELQDSIPEPYVFEGPKPTFELPPDYRPPPASFYESTVVGIINEEEEIVEINNNNTETKNEIKRELDPLTLESMGGSWTGGDANEYYQKKIKREEHGGIFNGNMINDSSNNNSKVPTAVRIDAEERLEMLRKTNPEEALKYEIEVETLGDRKKLYREQALISEGKITLSGDAGHLNRSDLNVVKKKINLTTTGKGFKKRAVPSSNSSKIS